jgi:hypothetical protein
MPPVSFDLLPPAARLWIFAASRPLSASERERLLGEVDAFLADWKAHGQPLTSARELRYDQFLFVAVDESSADASGCSIDAMVRRLVTLERELGVQLLDHGPVLYRDGDRVLRVARPEFAALVSRGQASEETTVFDNTLTTVGDLRAGNWEVPARESWHARAFFRHAARPA